jgi:hypothetical protein
MASLARADRARHPPDIQRNDWMNFVIGLSLQGSDVDDLSDEVSDSLLDKVTVGLSREFPDHEFLVGISETAWDSGTAQVFPQDDRGEPIAAAEATMKAIRDTADRLSIVTDRFRRFH